MGVFERERELYQGEQQGGGKTSPEGFWLNGFLRLSRSKRFIQLSKNFRLRADILLTSAYLGLLLLAGLFLLCVPASP